MKYAVIFETSPTGFSAYVPDLDGCVATGATLYETRALMAEALAIHVAAMIEDGEPVPKPSRVELLEFPVAV